MLFREWGVSLWLEILPAARDHKVIIVFMFIHMFFSHFFSKKTLNQTHVKDWPASKIVEDSLEALLSGASELSIWSANRNWLREKSI